MNKYYGTEDEKFNSEYYANADMQNNQNYDKLNDGKRNNNPPSKFPNDEII